MKRFGFWKFIGGIGVCILAVLLAILGFVVLLGLINIIPTSLDVPLGIGILIAALLMFAYGWYSYKSAKPKGTVRVDQ